MLPVFFFASKCYFQLLTFLFANVCVIITVAIGSGYFFRKISSVVANAVIKLLVAGIWCIGNRLCKCFNVVICISKTSLCIKRMAFESALNKCRAWAVVIAPILAHSFVALRISEIIIITPSFCIVK